MCTPTRRRQCAPSYRAQSIPQNTSMRPAATVLAHYNTRAGHNSRLSCPPPRPPHPTPRLLGKPPQAGLNECPTGSPFISSGSPAPPPPPPPPASLPSSPPLNLPIPARMMGETCGVAGALLFPRPESSDDIPPPTLEVPDSVRSCWRSSVEGCTQMIGGRTARETDERVRVGLGGGVGAGWRGR